MPIGEASLSLPAVGVRSDRPGRSWLISLDAEQEADVEKLEPVLRIGPQHAATRDQDVNPFGMGDRQALAVRQYQAERTERLRANNLAKTLGFHFSPPFRLLNSSMIPTKKPG